MIELKDQDLENAISNVSRIFGIPANTPLEQDYRNGKHPSLLSYEKIEKPTIQIPVMQKYLIAARTYLSQPCNYYDIFRICRHVILLHGLSQAVNVVLDKVSNYEPRFSKLAKITEYDDFEAVLYEILVAAKYFTTPDVTTVSFLPEETSPSPDIEVGIADKKVFVECKKFDRAVDLSNELRNLIRKKTDKIPEDFAKLKQSVVVEVSYHVDPNNVPEDKVRQYAITSLRSGTPIVDLEVTVKIIPLLYQKLPEFVLYPSPKYFWNRYGFRERGEWFGIVLAMYANRARHAEAVGEDNLISTWLDDVEWECAIKWKITNPDIIWRLKRLGYSRLFKGLDQLQSQGINNILHCWFERDYPLGNREEELLEFYNRLRRNARDLFSWIIFNETCFDVSYEGRFDLIEHSHRIRGPGARGAEPLLSTIFTDPIVADLGRFGVGVELPDVDSLYKDRTHE